MSEIFEDFKRYRDPNGLNSLYTDGARGVRTQNGALFTMEYLVCLLDRMFDDDEKVIPEIYQETVSEIARIRGVFDSLEEKPGLSVLAPGSTEFDSMDNDGSLLIFSHLFGKREYATRHRNHGLSVECTRAVNSDKDESYVLLARVVSTLQGASIMKAKNYWNNQHPESFCLRGWYGRSPGHMGLIDICATGKTTWFRAASLLVGQLLSVFASPTNADAWKLPYVLWYCLRHRGWAWKLGYQLWKAALLWRHPGGMRDVYAMYYPENHPIRKWARPTAG